MRRKAVLMTFWKTYDSKMKSLKTEGGIVKGLDRSEAKVLVSESTFS